MFCFLVLEHRAKSCSLFYYAICTPFWTFSQEVLRQLSDCPKNTAYYIYDFPFPPMLHPPKHNTRKQTTNFTKDMQSFTVSNYPIPHPLVPSNNLYQLKTNKAFAVTVQSSKFHSIVNNDTIPINSYPPKTLQFKVLRSNYHYFS